MTLSKSAAEILVKEFDPILMPCLFPDLFKLLLALVRADKQSSGKSIEALLMGKLRRLLKPKAVAIGTALSLMAYNRTEVIDQIVAFDSNQWESQFLGQQLYRFQTLLVFRKWVNVGVIPAGTNFKVALSQPFDDIDGTGATTAVQEDRGHFTFQKLALRPFSLLTL